MRWVRKGGFGYGNGDRRWRHRGIEAWGIEEQRDRGSGWRCF